MGWRSRDHGEETRGWSCLKAELAHLGWVSLTVFGAQASLEFGVCGVWVVAGETVGERLQQEKPKLAQRTWGRKGKASWK